MFFFCEKKNLICSLTITIIKIKILRVHIYIIYVKCENEREMHGNRVVIVERAQWHFWWLVIRIKRIAHEAKNLILSDEFSFQNRYSRSA